MTNIVLTYFDDYNKQQTMTFNDETFARKWFKTLYARMSPVLTIDGVVVATKVYEQKPAQSFNASFMSDYYQEVRNGWNTD